MIDSIDAFLKAGLATLVWTIINAGIGAGVNEAILEAKPLGWMRNIIRSIDVDLKECAICLSYWSVLLGVVAEIFLIGWASLFLILTTPFAWRLSHVLHDAQRLLFSKKASASISLDDLIKDRMRPS